MNENPRSLQDGQEGRGSVNVVVRQGGHVLRPLGEWSAAVQALLQRLSERGFVYSPRVLGVEEGRERLTYIDGQVAMWPWPECLLASSGLEQIGCMLRSYHDAVGDYEPQPHARWRDPAAKWHPGMVIRHGDLGPWNMVWESGRLVGLIDWDLAEPGYPVEDLAQAAWYCVPLRAANGCRDAGVDPGSVADRMECLCASYGIDPDLVLEAVTALERKEISRTKRLASQGVEPWVGFHSRGDADEIEQELRWLNAVTQGVQQGARLDALKHATRH